MGMGELFYFPQKTFRVKQLSLKSTGDRSEGETTLREIYVILANLSSLFCPG